MTKTFLHFFQVILKSIVLVLVIGLVASSCTSKEYTVREYRHIHFPDTLVIYDTITAQLEDEKNVPLSLFNDINFKLSEQSLSLNDKIYIESDIALVITKQLTPQLFEFDLTYSDANNIAYTSEGIYSLTLGVVFYQGFETKQLWILEKLHQNEGVKTTDDIKPWLEVELEKRKGNPWNFK
jgi:hypothetical protein